LKLVWEAPKVKFGAQAPVSNDHQKVDMIGRRIDISNTRSHGNFGLTSSCVELKAFSLLLLLKSVYFIWIKMYKILSPRTFIER